MNAASRSSRASERSSSAASDDSTSAVIVARSATAAVATASHAFAMTNPFVSRAPQPNHAIRSSRVTATARPRATCPSCGRKAKPKRLPSRNSFIRGDGSRDARQANDRPPLRDVSSRARPASHNSRVAGSRPDARGSRWSASPADGSAGRSDGCSRRTSRRRRARASHSIVHVSDQLPSEHIAAGLPGTADLMVLVGNAWWKCAYAARGGNWPLAAFYARRVRNLQRRLAIIRPKYAERLAAFETGMLGPVFAALETQDRGAFDRAFAV